MSEEIHDEVVETETPVQTEADSSPAPVEPEVETPSEPEETPEEKVARLQEENEKLSKGISKQKQRIDKITRKKYEEAEKLQQELEESRKRLQEYTGEEYQQPTTPAQNQTPTREQLKAEIKYDEEVEQLKSNTEVMELMQKRASTSSNPFVNNPLIDQVVRQVGFPLNIVETILKDDDLCDSLSETEDPYRITKLLTKAQVRHELASNQEEAPPKQKRIAKKPPAKPSGASGNRADVKSMSPEAYAAHRRKQKYGI
jgi:hypothetical protein